MAVLKRHKDMKLFIDSNEKLATSITLEGQLDVPDYAQPHRVEFWPDGKWEPGYLVERALIDMYLRAAVGEPVLIDYEIRGGPVIRIRPVWWRRLLKPIRNLLCYVRR